MLAMLTPIVDGCPMLAANSISVRSDIGNHRLQIYTGWFGQEIAVRPETAPTAVAGARIVRKTAEENAKTAEAVMLSGSANCPCCAGAA